MKQIIVLCIILLLLVAPIGIAAGNDNGSDGVDDSSAGDDSSRSNGLEPKETETSHEIEPKETETSHEIEPKETETSHEIEPRETEIEHGVITNTSELEIRIQERETEIERELEQERIQDRQIIRNQSIYLVGLDSLRQVEELNRSFAQNLSELENEWNQSVRVTLEAENRIRTRSSFIRFFVGGDAEAARNLEQQIEQNQERIREMEQLVEQCACSDEVKALLREQIRQMVQEQDRLRSIARLELEDKGIFGQFFR